MFASYRRVLAVGGVRRLLASSLLGRLPLGISSLAILLLVRDASHSFAKAGLAVAAFTLAAAALAPLQGALIDRVGQPSVLWMCGSVQAVLYVVLVAGTTVHTPSALTVVLAFGAGAFMPPLSSCARALWGELFPEPGAREAAYALDAASQELIWTLGPLVTGVAVAIASPAAAVLLCAVMTIVGTAVFASAPSARAWRGSGLPRSRLGPLASSRLRTVLYCLLLASFGVGILQVGLPAVAVQAGSPAAAGVLLATWSVGSMIGAVVYGTRRWRRPAEDRYALLLLVLAVAPAPLIAIHSLAGSIPLSALAGLPLAALLTCQFTLVGRLAPDGTTTEAFAWNISAAYAGMSVGVAVAGILVKTVGLGATFAVACLGGIVASAIAAVARRRLVLPQTVGEGQPAGG